ncbi:MAG: hypothetical protein GY800_06625 [Planctomycetes bacterium]|nr:hypothetical protein [Planctomycetota bacterium]
MGIEIQYLAARINPSLNRFDFCIHGVSNLAFTTWPGELNAKPEVLKDMPSIFAPDLEIFVSGGVNLR